MEIERLQQIKDATTRDSFGDADRNCQELKATLDDRAKRIVELEAEVERQRARAERMADALVECADGEDGYSVDAYDEASAILKEHDAREKGGDRG
jgi:hypothetical protein